MIFGINVRFYDLHEMLKYNPTFVEFHFTEKDLDEKISEETFPQGLVVHCPEYKEYKLVDLGSLGETNQFLSREQSVEMIKKTIEKVKELSKKFKGEGKPRLVIHPGGYSMNPVSPEVKAKMIENLKISVKELLNPDVELYLENLPPYPWFFGGQYICNVFLDAEEIKQFCDDTGISICFDTSHNFLYCNNSGKKLIDQIRILKPYIKHLHISDGDGVDGEGMNIGDGGIKWNELMDEINTFPPETTFIPEIWKGYERKGEGFGIAIERLKKYMKIGHS